VIASPYDLNLRHLRAIVAVRECGSITAASRFTHLSQPALTQGIAKLERQLDCTLFERRIDGVSATAAGHMVADRVRAVIDHVDGAARRLDRQVELAARLISMTQVRALLALAETTSFASAAAQADLSQTAVHRAVGDLEQLLGRSLVDRRGRGILLSPSGGKLARGLRLAMGELRALLSELDGAHNNPLIVFGSLPLSRPKIVPTAIAMMRAESDRARFSIAEGSWQDLSEQLRDGVIDLIVGAFGEDEMDDLVHIPLTEDHLVVLCGGGHPLAGVAHASAEELARYDWIVAPPHTPLRRQWEQLFANGRQPECPVECGSILVNVNLLAQSSFLTLASPRQVELPLQMGKLARVGGPIPGSTRPVGITTRRGWHPTSTEQRFMELLHDAARLSAPEIVELKHLVLQEAL
jgi:LysR family transcriptional regulator, regulator for genes of the gallate degradation pathway